MNKIAAIGEILFDVYPDSRKLGGAPLNFLYHVFKLIGQGTFISRVGNDEAGKEILEFLNKHNVSSKFIQIDEEHPTGAATVKLKEKKEPVFIIEENRAYDFIELTDDVEKIINEETSCLYFGLLAQRSEVTRNTIHSLMEKNITYFCDLNIRQNFYNKEIINKSLIAADILKINFDEIKLLNDLLLDDAFELNHTSSNLMDKYEIDLLAVTKGEEGSSLFMNGNSDNYKMNAQGIIDTVGAGDAFASILCIGYLNNWELKTINKFANKFALEICRTKGALPENDIIYKQFRGEIEYETK